MILSKIKPRVNPIRDVDQIRNIVIIGAGLSGLAAAIGLRKSGYTVTVLERNSELQDVGAGIQIPANSSRILHELGVLDRVRTLSVKPESLVIRSYRGTELYTQTLGAVIEKKFHYPHLLVHRADIRRVLFDEANALGANLQFNTCVETLNPGTGMITVAGGKYYAADLIIGADGEHSICRSALLDRTDAPRSSGDVVFRIAVPSALIEADSSISSLIERPMVHAWYGPNSHAVCYQLQKGGIFNIVLTLPEECGAVTIGPQVADLTFLRDSCKLWDSRFRKLLELADHSLKWTLLETEELCQWSHPSGKLILIGDSAHASLPYLAQGAAMALESAFTLSMVLSQHPIAMMLPSLLATYTDMRRLRTSRARKRSKQMHDICQLVDGPEQQERDRVLKEQRPGRNFPNPWADPEFQTWMWSYDAKEAATKCWRTWKLSRPLGRLERL